MKRKRNWPVTFAFVLALLACDRAQAFYNPSTGRWLSRDPIAERGGKTLYGFAGNDAIRHTDSLGLKFCFWFFFETTIGPHYHEKGVEGNPIQGVFNCVYYAVLELRRTVYCCENGRLAAHVEIIKKKGVMRKDDGHVFSEGDPFDVCKEWWEKNKPPDRSPWE